MTPVSGSALPVIFLMGPTASGKTRLALELAERLPVDLISVDSAQVYRGMDIGTAKPAPVILQRYPHKLIDICEPTESYSAARFAADAGREIAAGHGRGRVPLLVGGTLLYFRALAEPLSALPSADPLLRARLSAEADRLGWAALHARLAAADPQTAQRLHPNDSQRIQRALEILELTGHGPSVWHQQERSAPPPWRILKLIVMPGAREVLRQRITGRLQMMLAQGFLDEVRGLRARGDLHLDLPALRAVGYRQLWLHLDGFYDWDEAQRRCLTATQQFAKRQLTWLRRETAAIWLDSSGDGLAQKALTVLRDGGMLP
ncbi:MAG: tRNA (adenosine(37)-N6)-dimethylallyltransferase MiaA [Nevskiales bacterium]